MAKPKRKRLPGKRVEGAKKVNLARLRTLRAAANAAKINAPADEDTRVADVWDRQEGRERAAIKTTAEKKAIRAEASRSRQIVGTEERPNPYFAPEHPISRSNVRKTQVAVNLKESALVALFNRKLIDEGQAEAGEQFRRLWETMGGKGAGAMDYSKTPVDGGVAAQTVTERQIDAGRKLADAQTHLGVRGYSLVSKVCGEGFQISELFHDKRSQLSAMDLLRGLLDDLAELWLLKSRTTNVKRCA